MTETLAEELKCSTHLSTIATILFLMLLFFAAFVIYYIVSHELDKEAE